MIRLAIRVPREQAELVLAQLLELAPSGVEEVDPGAGEIEYAVYGAPGELPALPDLQAVVGKATVAVSSTEVPDDWEERWKQFHRPILIEAPEIEALEPASSGPAGSRLASPGLYVRPPWEPPSERAGVREIVIDPGQAFGTGAHATTRLCLELLLSLVALEGASGPLLDVGTGSGVLAIAAASLGYGPVLALDNDPLSVTAAESNAKVNEVQIEAQRLDLRTEELPPLAEYGKVVQDGQVVMLANLLRPLFVELERAIAAPPRHLIASGLLAAELDEVAALFAGRLHMHERERRVSGEWAALWLSRSRC